MTSQSTTGEPGAGEEEARPRQPRPLAFFALDRGTASNAAAIIGRLGGRWRLLGATVVPAGGRIEPVMTLLAGRMASADPALGLRLAINEEGPLSDDPATWFASPGIARAVDEWPRLEARTRDLGGLLLLAASERQRILLQSVAERAGWEVEGASAEIVDPVAMTSRALDPAVAALLIGADDPPGGDERDILPELAALGGAVARRRPSLPVVLAGAISRRRAAFGESAVTIAPAAGAGRPAGEGLRATLIGLLSHADDSRAGIARSVGSLARLLGRRVEILEIGANGGLWAGAEPPGRPARASREAVFALKAALVPAQIDDPIVDQTMGWLTGAIDRQRLRDRLRELRLDPWADAETDGPALREATLRAALGRLMAMSPEPARDQAPEVLLLAGGALAGGPPAGALLIVADTARRPGACQVVSDHARLLGPLGTIEDLAERERMLTDLLDDLLLPLGTVVIAGGLRASRSGVHISLHREDGVVRREAAPGALVRLDLPAGSRAVLELEGRSAIRLGGAGRHLAVEAAGGLGGLLIDLRDVPLRLPDRLERRREQLLHWRADILGDAAR